MTLMRCCCGEYVLDNGEPRTAGLWTHEARGTDFRPRSAKVGNEELENWLTHLLSPQVWFRIHEATLAGKRSLDEFYVTGATIEAGRMYAVSASFSTLLTLDLATHELVAAHSVAGIERPTGLAVKGDHLYIACADGRIVMVPRPS